MTTKRRFGALVGAAMLVLGTVGCSNIDDEARNAALNPPAGRTLTMRFLRSFTTSPVRGLKITVTEMATSKTFQAVSDTNGRVSIPGLMSDEYRVTVMGRPIGYSNGDVGCQTPKKVVPRDAACTHMAADLGDVYISRG